MLCRSCGTEIADKAIVCYRCGAATSDPVRKPVQIRRRRPILPAIALLIFVLVGLYLGTAGRAVLPPGFELPVAITIVVAIIVLVVRVAARRR
jgi:hypothetical protein